MNQDEDVKVKLITPGGLILSLDPDHIADPNGVVNGYLDANDDRNAALVFSNLTGCDVSIERTRQTTMRRGK